MLTTENQQRSNLQAIVQAASYSTASVFSPGKFSKNRDVSFLRIVSMAAFVVRVTYLGVLAFNGAMLEESKL